MAQEDNINMEDISHENVEENVLNGINIDDYNPLIDLMLDFPEIKDYPEFHDMV